MFKILPEKSDIISLILKVADPDGNEIEITV
jgi:hypothetical protein